MLNKKIWLGMLVMVLAMVCAGTVFAQEKKAGGKNAVTMDVIPLVRGFMASDSDAETFYFCMAFGYERLIVRHFSIGVDLDIWPGKAGEDFDGDNIPYFYFGMAAAGRFYPMSDGLEKFFFGAKFGFNVQAIDGKTNKYGGFVGPVIGLEAGYKLRFGKLFFVEPSIAFIYAKSGGGFGSEETGDDDDWGDLVGGLVGGLVGSFIGAPTPGGWQAGLRVGVSF